MLLKYNEAYRWPIKRKKTLERIIKIDINTLMLHYFSFFVNYFLRFFSYYLIMLIRFFIQLDALEKVLGNSFLCLVLYFT